MNLGGLVDHARFRSNAERVKHRADLDEIIMPMFAAQTSEYWLDRLHAADILCGPINTFADIAADPALADNLPLIDPHLQGVPRVMGTPIKFNGAYFKAERPRPEKGQHTREVLREFGFGDGEIDGFIGSGGAYVSDAA